MSDLPSSGEGGCLCRRTRFGFEGTPLWVAHCHCRSCRRNTGAAVATFVGVKADDFAWTKDTPARYESSPGVFRTFCPTCGGALTYEADRYPGEIHINIGALDQPDGFVPTVHVWTAEAVSWLHIDDDAPRYAQTARSTT